MMKSRLVYFLILASVNKIITVLFPIPIEFCVLDWILMVQAFYFLPHHPATNTWNSGAF